MKGFYITIKNGLLDPKHRERIDEAIWLFLWCLDKMTIINEEIGEGKVLGGKPIKYEEVNEELGISRATYKRWIAILKKGGYIKTIRTPYGLSITVFKAFKVFNQRSKRSIKIEPSNGSKVSHQKSVREPSNIRQDNRQYNKTEYITLSTTQSVDGKTTNDLIDLFKTVNPNWKRLFMQKPQRQAIERMAEDHGVDKLKLTIEQLEKTNRMKYAPSITTPCELERGLGKLVAFMQKEKVEVDKNKVIVL